MEVRRRKGSMDSILMLLRHRRRIMEVHRQIMVVVDIIEYDEQSMAFLTGDLLSWGHKEGDLYL